MISRPPEPPQFKARTAHAGQCKYACACHPHRLDQQQCASLNKVLVFVNYIQLPRVTGKHCVFMYHGNSRQSQILFASYYCYLHTKGPIQHNFISLIFPNAFNYLRDSGWTGQHKHWKYMDSISHMELVRSLYQGSASPKRWSRRRVKLLHNIYILQLINYYCNFLTKPCHLSKLFSTWEEHQLSGDEEISHYIIYKRWPNFWLQVIWLLIISHLKQ